MPPEEPTPNVPSVGALGVVNKRLDPSVPAVGSLGVVNKRMIVWGPDGVPRPSSVPTISKQGIEDLAAVALSLPFKPKEIPFELTVPLPLDASEVQKNAREMALMEAEHELEQEREFEGMTNAEVMIVKLARSAAGGDPVATSMMLDRVLGKPKQSVESKSMTMTYADVLKEKAARAASARGEEAIDVVVEIAREANEEKPFGELDGLL